MSYKEWKEYSLGELLDITSSKRIFYSEYVERGIPFFRSKEIIERFKGNNISTELFISKKRYDDIKNKFGVPQKNDLLLTSVGTIGIPYLVKDNEQFYFKDGNLTWFKNYANKIDGKFLFYWIISPFGKYQMEIRKIGTTQQALTIDGIRRIQINLPNFQTQEKIASILSSLDDKIELNRQTNQTLETIAQTLFKEMCLPKSEELAEGWRVGKLGEVLEIKYGKDHKHLETGEIPCYGSGGIMRYVNQSLYEKESILIPRKGTLSNLFYINKPFWSVDTMFYSKIKDTTYSKFLFLLLKTMNLASMNVGSAVPSLTTELLNNLEIIIPSNDILKKFDDLVTPTFEMLVSNIEQNQTLISIRDSLLPKLMKGEIEV